MSKKNVSILIISLVAVALLTVIYLMNRKINDSRQKIQELEKSLLNSNIDYLKMISTRDSLLKVNQFLSQYKALTVAMTYRDNVRQPLKYGIGQTVQLRRDSSKAVVSDIIVGGGKHEYYIKYKIVFPDNREEYIVPDMLY